MPLFFFPCFCCCNCKTECGDDIVDKATMSTCGFGSNCACRCFGLTVAGITGTGNAANYNGVFELLYERYGTASCVWDGQPISGGVLEGAGSCSNPGTNNGWTMELDPSDTSRLRLRAGLSGLLYYQTTSDVEDPTQCVDIIFTLDTLGTSGCLTGAPGSLTVTRGGCS